jgi:sucrose-6F-phosphate phosphohydrolase
MMDGEQHDLSPISGYTQPVGEHPGFLLASDLDNTLVGDDASLVRFTRAFTAIRSRVKLVYVTGRSFGMCSSLCQGQTALPAPDYWITSIGAEIYEDGRLDTSWRTRMDEGWNRARLVEIARTFAEIGPHPDPRLQTPWRIIFHVDPRRFEIVSGRFRDLAEAEGIRAQFIFSHGVEIDIVPSAGNKGNALTEIAGRLGIGKSRVIGCGDSGNDISLLEAAGKGIVVANAQEELREWYRTSHDHCYLASMPYAAGVLEGLERLGIL